MIFFYSKYKTKIDLLLVGEGDGGEGWVVGD